MNLAWTASQIPVERGTVSRQEDRAGLNCPRDGCPARAAD
jgi:hypothetical protein